MEPMSPSELKYKIERREAVLGVIGLGYVGLTVACAFAEAGFQVVGLDIKADRVAMIRDGLSPIAGREPGLAELLAHVVSIGRLRATTDYVHLAEADVVLIDVETPVNADHHPEYSALTSACRSLGQIMKDGALIIVESTISPGTMNNIVCPLLEQASSRRVNVGFYLGTCPERVMPGKLLSNLHSISRVCGGFTPETAELMATLYRSIVHAELNMTDVITAEMVKTTENAYRDVQIAFANEVALICEAVGANVWRVRELVNKSPFRQMHMPGAGVGGHCIPKDPWLLIHAGRDKTASGLITAARAVNDRMPLHMADLTVQALRDEGRDIVGAKVAVLGYSYLEDTDDTRNSPSERLVARLRQLEADVVIHDPWVTEYQGQVLDCVRDCDAIVVMVAHQAYRVLDLAALKTAVRSPILIDGRRVFSVDEALKAGFHYRGVGQSRVSQ